MISKPLYALLLATGLVTVASQVYYSPPAEGTTLPALVRNETVHSSSAKPSAPQASSSPAADKGQDLFASQLPPPPPPPPAVVVVPPPPEPPKAPPLPYRYLGLMDEDGTMHIYLKKGENTVVTHVGDKLEDSYLVKRLDRNGITFVYLPLGQEQQLSLQVQ